MALRLLVLLAVVALTVPACSRGEADSVARVDGGTEAVALLGEVVVPVAAGSTVTIRHASEPTAEAEEAPVTHAFVSAREADALPPIFARRAGGLSPNPAVWGACRGGSTEEAQNDCPVPPIEGPSRWDGSAYWSTGAMLPGETREVPIAEDIPRGDHMLICALHPGLRVVVRVGAAAPDRTERDVESDVSTALAFAAEGDPHRGPNVVDAGISTGDAYVAQFAPAEIRVAAGGSVTWRAGSRTPVDVVFGTAEDEEVTLTHTEPRDALPTGNADGWDGRGKLSSGFLSADPTAGAAAATWTATFTRPGTYRYVSRFSPTLTGTVVVE